MAFQARPKGGRRAIMLARPNRGIGMNRRAIEQVRGARTEMGEAPDG